MSAKFFSASIARHVNFLDRLGSYLNTKFTTARNFICSITWRMGHCPGWRQQSSPPKFDLLAERKELAQAFNKKKSETPKMESNSQSKNTKKVYIFNKLKLDGKNKSRVEIMPVIREEPDLALIEAEEKY